MWEDPSKYLTLWTEAMRAKYFGDGEPWGRRELDVVLGKFDVCTFPASIPPRIHIPVPHSYHVSELRLTSF